ncbi:Glycerophosphoryl diester phosphodiesterase [compost metagenome]
MMFALVLLLAVIVALVVRHKTWRPQAWPSQGLQPPLIQGHRGYWKEGMQENSMASFRAAQGRGLKMIEFDVRLSKDGIPVVFHDESLERIAQSSKNVLELTAVELNQLAQAPSLEEVLIATDIPQLLNVELKTKAAFDGRLEEQVAMLVRKHGAERRVLFSSFNPLSMRRLSKLLPEVPRALLASRETDPANKIYLKKLWLAPYIGVHLLHLDKSYWTPEEVQAYKKRGIPVALWTVNERELADKYLQAGAISIISDTLV